MIYTYKPAFLGNRYLETHKWTLYKSLDLHLMLNNEGAILFPGNTHSVVQLFWLRLNFFNPPHEIECNQSDWRISVSNHYKLLKSSAGLWKRRRKKKKEKPDVAISSVCASDVCDFLSCLELIVWYSLLIFMLLSPKCRIDIPLLDHKEKSTWVAKNRSRIPLSHSFHVT